jgi:hypothetical protein
VIRSLPIADMNVGYFPVTYSNLWESEVLSWRSDFVTMELTVVQNLSQLMSILKTLSGFGGERGQFLEELKFRQFILKRKYYKGTD